jgi:phage-related protein
MEIIYWNEKIEKFIIALDHVTATRVVRTIDLLGEHGHLLSMPDSKSLGKGLFELRTQGKVKVRILYIFHKNKAFLVHGFVKKMWKINPRDIEYARKIQKEIIESIK